MGASGRGLEEEEEEEEDEEEEEEKRRRGRKTPWFRSQESMALRTGQLELRAVHMKHNN